MKIQKSVLLYTWPHLIWNHWTSSKNIKQLSCMVIMGNRGIWFGTIFHYMVMEGNKGVWFGAIFPYMVMVGNKGIWFCAIMEYYRCCVLAWACSLPFFYLINPMCLICVRGYSCIQSRDYCPYNNNTGYCWLCLFHMVQYSPKDFPQNSI